MNLFIVLSKLFVFFITPVNWVILLLVSRMFIHRNKIKRWVTYAAVIIFVLFSNKFIYKMFIANWEAPAANLTGKHFSAGILLGGIGRTEHNNQTFFGRSSDRFIQTCRLYKQGIISKVVVSAGSIDNVEPLEAPFLHRQLLDMGVKEEDIIVEDRSRNTAENASNTKQMVDALHLPGPFVLITSAAHMPRAQKVFSKSGLDVVPFPCDYDGADQHLYFSDYILPDMDTFHKWRFLLKEWFGMAAYSLTGKL